MIMMLWALRQYIVQWLPNCNILTANYLTLITPKVVCSLIVVRKYFKNLI